MSTTFGKNLRLTVFGESHGPAIGGVLDGLSPGMRLDLEEIETHMRRRAPGRHALSTKRQEKDAVEILSGFFEGRTTGAPLAFMIPNNDARSKDYEKMRGVLRPGHADYSVHCRYGGYQDARGSGYFSGRLTAALVFAGSVARQYLSSRSVEIFSQVCQVAEISAPRFVGGDLTPDNQVALREMDLPVLEASARQAMEACIKEASKEKDSVGAMIEAVVTGVPAGLGDPFFDSLESSLAHLLFSVPGVKALEFGSGFAMAQGRGSKMNDAPFLEDGRIAHRTNHNGGISGGISNGMPIVFRLAVRPPASIEKKQTTVDLKNLCNAELSVQGRHDPCIGPRVVPVIESAAALVIADYLLGQRKDLSHE